MKKSCKIISYLLIKDMDLPREALTKVLKECGASSSLLVSKTLIDELIASIAV